MEELFPLDSELVFREQKGWLSSNVSSERVARLNPLFNPFGKVLPFSRKNQTKLSLLTNLTSGTSSRDFKSLIDYGDNNPVQARRSSKYNVFTRGASRKTQELHIFNNLISRKENFAELAKYIYSFFDSASNSQSRSQSPLKS